MKKLLIVFTVYFTVLLIIGYMVLERLPEADPGKFTLDFILQSNWILPGIFLAGGILSEFFSTAKNLFILNLVLIACYGVVSLLIGFALEGFTWSYVGIAVVAMGLPIGVMRLLVKDDPVRFQKNILFSQGIVLMATALIQIFYLYYKVLV